MLKSRLQARFADPASTLGLIWRLLTEFGAPRWHRYALAFLLMAVAASVTALSAYLVGEIINKAYVSRDFAAVVQVGLLIMVLFIVRGAAVYGHSVTLDRVGNSIIAENQRRLFDRLQQQNLAYFGERHSSELMARFFAGAAAVKRTLSLIITSLGRDLLTLIGLVCVMIYQDPIAFLTTCVAAPPIILILRKMASRVRGVAMAQWHGGVQTLETMQETVQGIRTVKSFTLEDRMRARFDDNVAAVEKESNKLARVINRTSPLVETLGGITVAIVMIYAGYRLINASAAPGGFFSFLTAFMLAYEPAKRLVRLNLDLHAALIQVRVLLEVIDSPATEKSDEGLPALKVPTARLEFSHVTFAYRPGDAVLRDMSFVAEPGSLTALVGPSGGGKSTVLNLILRFYDAQSGVITIDGQDIITVSRHSLRRQISYVGQDVFLFRATIRENIAFGRSDATDADIVAAAKAAQAHDFIMSFPKGYDTMVGERGADVSGGERQRIAIARALIRNAPLILLDEATASLDSESEYQVQKAIAELCKGRTTIVIAHRLSTIRHADRILVIEDGRVTDSGRHDELLRNGGRYASFYRLQLQQQDAPAPIAAVQGR